MPGAGRAWRACLHAAVVEAPGARLCPGCRPLQFQLTSPVPLRTALAPPAATTLTTGCRGRATGTAHGGRTTCRRAGALRDRWLPREYGYRCQKRGVRSRMPSVQPIQRCRRDVMQRLPPAYTSQSSPLPAPSPSPAPAAVRQALPGARRLAARGGPAPAAARQGGRAAVVAHEAAGHLWSGGAQPALAGPAPGAPAVQLPLPGGWRSPARSAPAPLTALLAALRPPPPLLWQPEVSPWDGKQHRVHEVTTELHSQLRRAVKRFLADGEDKE